MQKKLISTIILVLLFSFLSSTENLLNLLKEQKLDEAFVLMKSSGNNDIELWRSLGFLYKQNNQLDNAIAAYKSVYSFDSNDYDARLALGRLYYDKEQFQEATKFFQMILANDKTDVEAYLGLARVFSATEEFGKSVYYYNSALEYLPGYVTALFELAKVYSYDNNLDAAILTYRQIIDIDDTYSEAYAGIGRMLWWSNKPLKALEFYEKALLLDPSNTEIKDEINKVKRETIWDYSLKFSFGNEEEEDYEISFIQHNYSVSKRVNDFIQIKLNSNWQYSQKKENRITVERYYDSSLITTDLMLKNNRFSCILGGSINDSTISVSEMNWEFRERFKNIKLVNKIGSGEKYFYFWKRVRKQYVHDNLQIDWKKLSFTADYEVGKVLKNWIWNKYSKVENPFVNYSYNLKYKFMNIPKLTLNGNYRFMDYKYDSSLYYSPSNREIFGASVSAFYEYRDVYLYGNFGFFKDNNDEYESNYDYEIGWNFSGFSIALSISKFNNDYYKSDNISLVFGGSL